MPSNRLTRDIKPYEYLRTGDDTKSSEIRRSWGLGNGEPLPESTYRGNRRAAPLYTGKQWVGGVDYRFRPVTDAMSYLMRKHDYMPTDGNWGGNRRKVRGGNTWSTHAFLCAVDTHAPQNPMSRSFVTDMPPALIEDWLSIRTVDGSERAVLWGGFWRTADAMHVNANVEPAALAGGVRCADGTVFEIGGPRTDGPLREAAGSNVVVSLGSKSDAVFRIQRLLVEEGLLEITDVDGAFGPITETAVIRWQQTIGVDDDGIWGPGTEAATREYVAGRDSTEKPAAAPPSPDGNPPRHRHRRLPNGVGSPAREHRAAPLVGTTRRRARHRVGDRGDAPSDPGRSGALGPGVVGEGA